MVVVGISTDHPLGPSCVFVGDGSVAFADHIRAKVNPFLSSEEQGLLLSVLKDMVEGSIIWSGCSKLVGDPNFSVWVRESQ